MTDKPRTSFLIEDILSLKDSAKCSSKCCSQKTERCSQWTEESEKLSEQLCPQDTAFGTETGELLQAWISSLTFIPIMHLSMD